METFWSSLALLSSLLVTSRGYPTGAPLDFCNSSTPIHGVPQQNSPSPYSVILVQEKIKPGESIKLTITSSNDVFKGYLVTAWKQGTKERIGSFKGPGKFLSCHGGTNNGATHANSEDKVRVELIWTAPEDFHGVVQFDATVVKVHDQFWTGIMSKPLTVE